MKAFPPRIAAMILLVVALLALSGIAATAEALAHAEAAGACCSGDSNEMDSGAGPCSVPDCPCVYCLTIDLAALPTVYGAAAALAAFSPHRQLFPLSEFINSIDYPPEPS